MARLNVRLDAERWRRLQELAAGQGVSNSEIVRSMIDSAYGEHTRERRERAVERLLALNGERPPEPRILSRQLEAAHEPGGLP